MPDDDAACDVALLQLLLPPLLESPRNVPVERGRIDSGDTRERDSAIAKVLSRVGHGNPMTARGREGRAGAGVWCALTFDT